MKQERVQRVECVACRWFDFSVSISVEWLKGFFYIALLLVSFIVYRWLRRKGCSDATVTSSKALTRWAMWPQCLGFMMSCWLLSRLVELGVCPWWVVLAVYALFAVALIVTVDIRFGDLAKIHMKYTWSSRKLPMIRIKLPIPHFVLNTSSRHLVGVISLRGAVSAVNDVDLRLKLAFMEELFLSLLMVAFAFGVMYRCLSLSDVSSFHVSKQLSANKIDYFDFVYFSAITLTALGYGDISPTSLGAEALVVAEVLIGMFYVVCLVGGLASRIMSHPQEDTPSGDCTMSAPRLTKIASDLNEIGDMEPMERDAQAQVLVEELVRCLADQPTEVRDLEDPAAVGGLLRVMAQPLDRITMGGRSALISAMTKLVDQGAELADDALVSKLIVEGFRAANDPSLLNPTGGVMLAGVTAARYWERLSNEERRQCQLLFGWYEREGCSDAVKLAASRAGQCLSAKSHALDIHRLQEELDGIQPGIPPEIEDMTDDELRTRVEAIAGKLPRDFTSEEALLCRQYLKRKRTG